MVVVFAVVVIVLVVFVLVFFVTVVFNLVQIIAPIPNIRTLIMARFFSS